MVIVEPPSEVCSRMAELGNWKVRGGRQEQPGFFSSPRDIEWLASQQARRNQVLLTNRGGKIDNSWSECQLAPLLLVGFQPALQASPSTEQRNTTTHIDCCTSRNNSRRRTNFGRALDYRRALLASILYTEVHPGRQKNRCGQKGFPCFRSYRVRSHPSRSSRSGHSPTKTYACRPMRSTEMTSRPN